MTVRKFFKKLTSLILTLAMVLTLAPTTFLAVNAATGAVAVADGSTADTWKNFFPVDPNNLSTKNAGGIWTDKSVFTSNALGITKDANEDFLVALSAIASNMSIKGQSSVPTDTMFVLDVSGSMDGREAALVEAVNQSIGEILKNANSRVGIVLYSGSSGSSTNSTASVVLLPLGHYRTGTDGVFIYHDTSWSWSSGTKDDIVLDLDVVYDGGTNDGQRPSTTSKEVDGATYIQRGLTAALAQFKNQTIAQSETRKPIIVLMSDGAPTLGSTNFKTTGQYNIGSGGSSSAALGFVTQLTAAYTKKEVSAHYGTQALFYTLGLGLTNINSETERNIATLVLDPDDNTTTTAATSISDFWTRYNNAVLTSNASSTNDNNRVSLGDGDYVVKTEDLKAFQNYADKDFAAAGTNDLVTAFQQIVNEIALQSKYYPTLVEGAEKHSGFVSFVDKVGEYMNVTEIKGILIHGDLFSGADLSSNFVAGGGLLGSFEQSTDLGNEFVWVVMDRIGVDADTARTLISLAYQNGQLAYTNSTDFSNYIGWYANAKGEYLGFWHEGISTMPNPNDTSLTDETRPYYIIKSYGYLGETDATKGVDKSNMLYATVQVREEILTGEQTVTFAVPAALIPTITYEVSLNDSGDFTGLTATGADEPIRLVYGVELDKDINAWSMHELVSADYIAANTNENGEVMFYANKFEKDGSTGYNKNNAYAYFSPSFENDRYYYQENTYIYNHDDTLATQEPSGDGYYHKIDVYEVKNGNLSVTSDFEKLLPITLNDKEKDTTGYYIPAGHVRRDYADVQVPKAQDNTNLVINFSAAPFADYGSESDSAEIGHRFVFGATLGNNGIITLAPETGIAITKQLEAGATATDEPFTFELTNTANAQDNTEYPAFIRENGVSTQTSVKFTNGVASANVKAGQTLHIGGMTAGDVIKVSEKATSGYVLKDFDGDEQKTSVNLTVVDGTFVATTATNTDRGEGSVVISKEIHHNYGANYTIPDLSFTVELTFEGQGVENTTFPAVLTNAQNVETQTSVTTVNGKAEYTLKHAEQIVINSIPSGTSVNVKETNAGTGFTAKYSVNGGTAAEAADGAAVEVALGQTEWVNIQNHYSATSVSPNLEIKGVKNFASETAFAGEEEFKFNLQRYNPDGTWTTIGTQQSVIYTDETGVKNFTFGTALNSEVYSAVGSYSYRVVETIGTNAQIVYDEALHSFTVNVTDSDIDGALEISSVTTTRPAVVDVTVAGEVTASFTNTYENENTTVATIEVAKSVENLSGAEAGKNLAGFEFELSGDTLQTPVTLSTNDRGGLRFTLPFKASDLGAEQSKVFNYTLKELDGGKAGITYDTAERNFTVTLTLNDDSTISAVVTEAGGTNTTAHAVTNYVNKYNPEPATLAVNFVKKVLDGREMIAQDSFSFGVFKIVNSEGTEVASGTNNSQGVVTFDNELEFTQVGYYEFQIKETSEDKANDGITNDKNVYNMVVVVTDDPDNAGKLKATHTLLNQASEIVFKNIYTLNDGSFTVEGTKKLEGRTLVNDEFGFEMVECKSDGSPVEGATVYTARNLTNGSFTFPEIKITKADIGTRYYKITEVEPEGDKYGIVYDPDEFIVKVEIRDNLSGQMVADVTYPADGVVFENVYDPDDAVVESRGTKVLSGTVPGDRVFSFRLFESNDNTYAKDKLLHTVKNNAQGEFSFPELTFDKVGTYYYVVDEVNDGQEDIIYDETVYRVKIEVTDNLRGKLIPTVYLLDGEDVPQAEIIFNNKHKIPDPVTLDVNVEKTYKSYTGRLFDANGFYFEITDGKDFTSIVTSDKQGNAKFTLEFTGDDVGKTLTYYVSETNKTRTNVSYSRAVYEIAVEVSLDNDGKIVLTVKKDGELTMHDNVVAEFINYYNRKITPPDTPRNPTTGGVIR